MFSEPGKKDNENYKEKNNHSIPMAPLFEQRYVGSLVFGVWCLEFQSLSLGFQVLNFKFQDIKYYHIGT